MGRRPAAIARRPRGITLVELIVAVGVLATLLAIVIPGSMNYAAHARLAARVSEVSAGKVGAEMRLLEGSRGKGCRRTRHGWTAHDDAWLNYSPVTGWTSSADAPWATPGHWAAQGCVSLHVP